MSDDIAMTFGRLYLVYHALVQELLTANRNAMDEASIYGNLPMARHCNNIADILTKSTGEMKEVADLLLGDEVSKLVN